ncbi:hypothetical protein HL667_00030 [Bradyrhizobium sp. 83012]|uniref:Uncharacterized protein n=1 Tax=Bradyrhizobium aeschynomenes TaxID=2734909 RepID=A0ABX2C5Y5_9BRAD|nr:hypothetical protein [Bradyrhizobium aeschynomenes]NPU63383.1 hypothetical protein [Bradyrhizobium aeschynomenes]
MPIETEADRAVFVNPDEFGAIAIYTPAGGVASAPFHGQFDDPMMSAGLNDVMTLDTRPTFFCRSADLPAGAESGAGDGLQVAGEGTFSVVTVEPDGQGMTLLRLGA